MCDEKFAQISGFGPPESGKLHTPRAITNAANDVVWKWDSAPFGDTPANDKPTATLPAFTFNHRFPGQYFDEETGLHQNWHRDYDPVLGRYVQSDPIGLRGGVNTFAYATASPLNRKDPRGQDTLTSCEKQWVDTYYPPWLSSLIESLGQRDNLRELASLTLGGVGFASAVSLKLLVTTYLDKLGKEACPTIPDWWRNPAAANRLFALSRVATGLAQGADVAALPAVFLAFFATTTVYAAQLACSN
jgi:RHS repeat-associated protein